ncbi:glucose transporter type 3 [Drosophila novamexicana]|uniref:glucose transporter type 3 n=1 Tax=Drosophila novamexicana TaxID=47314 RepID=UPI0011E59267|nr:glucose transporter type 3 [Drosophila novamexicana]
MQPITEPSTSVTLTGIESRRQKPPIIRPTSKAGHQYLAGAISNFGVFCFGTTIGWTNIGHNLVSQKAYNVELTKDQWEWTNSMLPLGAACFCMPMGVLMKMYGCKPVMLFQMFPYVLGWSLLTFANNVYMVYVGRCVLGICGAALCVAVPVYNAEISRQHQRGAMISVFYGALVYGAVLNNILSEILSIKYGNVTCTLMALLCLSVTLIPESPSYYFLHGQLEKARKSMRWLRGDEYDINTELELLKQTLKRSDMELHQSCWGFMHNKINQRSVPRATILLMLYHISGGVIIMGHMGDILVQMADSSFNIYVMWLCVSMCLGHLICLLAVDRFGRRSLLLFSSVVMFMTSLFLCVWFKWMRSESWRWPALLSLFIFVASFSMGFGPVAWILYVELIPEHMRPFGCALAATISWLFATLLNIGFLFSVGHFSIFYFMLIVCMLGLLFVVIFIPETKNITSDEVQQVMKRGVFNDEHSSDDSF